MSATNVLKKLFCVMLAVGLAFGLALPTIASSDCPDCPPAELDGSIFPGGSCSSCRKKNTVRVSDKEVRIVEGTKKADCPTCEMPVFENRNYTFAAPRYKSDAADRDCCDLAPFALTHVDFKLDQKAGSNPYASHVGNYRFRIFGCRRAAKKALLNHGRVIQKDMMFQDVFAKSVDKCYKVTEIPNVCLEDANVMLPEYVLTAEITNFFMNVCDEHDWEEGRKANRRSGTAEMTVTWRLMNLSQSKVFWKGVTAGYSEVEDGVFEGEVKLAEDAFADAAARLSSLPGFEYQLSQRVSPEEMAAERAALVEFDRQFNPGKCNFAKEIAFTQTCAYAPQPQCPAIARPSCPCAQPMPCNCTVSPCVCPQQSCVCELGEPKVEEFVDVQTEKTTVEKKIITTTRVETPQPICRQVCKPVCNKKKTTTTTVTTTTETIEESCPMQCNQECTKPCRKVCTKTCVEGSNECTEKCVEDCEEKKPEPVKEVTPKVEEIDYIAPVEETSGIVIESTTVAPQVEEKSGITESHRVYENCIDEKGDVISDGSCTVIDDSWVDLEGYSVDAKLCIVDRPPYSQLNPENMQKIRSSVVEIANVKGEKGMGLIISDSFILTSAGLVNKLQNSYDVKTVDGKVLKAKAVRVNPSKNIALLHLDKPVTYTPISLNLDLPAIDQEGFTSLGLGENGKDYTDENGKIYGYRYSDTQGTEIIVDTLVQKVAMGSVLIDKLGTVNGISNSAKQTEEGMDLFLPTETALRSVGLSICEKLYEKKSPWQKTVFKPVTDKIMQETKAPEAMPEKSRK